MMDSVRVKQMAEYIYRGLSLREAMALSGVCISKKLSILEGLKLKQVAQYAKAKAKLDKLDVLDAIIKDTERVYTQTNLQALTLSLAQHGVTNDSLSRQQIKKMHEQNLAQKERALQQMADHYASKIVAEATAERLEQLSK